MIVVEGPDGAGKTTLIQEITEATGLPIAPRVVSKDTEAMVDLKKWTEENTARGFQATVFDRHRLISEPIYGAITRSTFEDGFDSPSWMYLQNHKFYNICRPLIIYCLPSFETVRQNVSEDWDNQPKRVREAIRKIYALYVAKAAQDASMIGSPIYDYTHATAPLTREMIIDQTRKACREGRSW